jgi:L-lysine exporter family protein LysE/ArgO
MIEAGIAGFLVSISLIAAIGAQNAFVLRQGLRREHVGAVVLTCAASDAVLIAAGVWGFGLVSNQLPWLSDALRWGGAAFLAIYGGLRFRAAFRGGEALMPASDQRAPLGAVLATCLLITWANPHVYLDTLVLIGSVSASYAPYSAAFGIGAVLASATFFTTIGYGARLLAPVFARPVAWVWMEVIIGLVMWAIALGLILG